MPSETIRIPGLDTETGMALYGDDIEIYLTVLQSYARNTPGVLDKLRQVSQENLNDYAINVHGLKGISANIGAVKIQASAYDLELKAKNGDLEGVLAANEAFLKEADELLQNLNTWLSEYEDENPQELQSRPDPQLLLRLKRCAQTFDMGGVDDIMDELEGAAYEEDGGLVRWLRDRVNQSDFASIVKRLSDYEEA